MNGRGFTLIELLVALALMLVVTAAIVPLVRPVKDATERALGASDVHGGARAVLDQLIVEVREAGSRDSVVGDPDRDAVFGSGIELLDDLDAGALTGVARAVRVTRIAHLAPQGVLAAPVAAGATQLQLRMDARCVQVGLACGLRAGMTAALRDGTRRVSVAIDSVGDVGLVRLTGPLIGAFPVGAVVVATTTRTYGLRPDPDGAFRLVRSSSGVEQPLVSSVVDFEVRADRPDPAYATRLDLRLRVEAPLASMRGRVARLFRRPGTALRPSQWVPDVELVASVTTRNGG
jgi:prepilin-type N-terminal cleavage/methylation domain-containing protein